MGGACREAAQTTRSRSAGDVERPVGRARGGDGDQLHHDRVAVKLWGGGENLGLAGELVDDCAVVRADMSVVMEKLREQGKTR